MQRVRKYKEEQDREFPDDPGVRTQYFHCRGPGSIPCQGTKIMPATWHSQEKKKKEEDEDKNDDDRDKRHNNWNKKYTRRNLQ